MRESRIRTSESLPSRSDIRQVLSGYSLVRDVQYFARKSTDTMDRIAKRAIEERIATQPKGRLARLSGQSGVPSQVYRNILLRGKQG